MVKYLLGALFFVASFTTPLSAGMVSSGAQTAQQMEVISHSGGCRKSSPPGKCCHAGSKPLHCH